MYKASLIAQTMTSEMPYVVSGSLAYHYPLHYY